MTNIWHTAPVSALSGEITICGDKSMSHRALLLAALAEGQTEIRGFLPCADCLATAQALRALGVDIQREKEIVTIRGVGFLGLQPPKAPLNMQNSGTSMRLLAGILAAQRFESVLCGDESLEKRPMQRIITPLMQMGAKIVSHSNFTAPLHISGRPLTGIDYALPLPSAQLKSCLILAGLLAGGTTRLHTCGISRDHTERMLPLFGGTLETQKEQIIVTGGQKLHGCVLEIVGDLSAAAFFMVAALIAPRAEVVIRNVGINPTRSAIITLLQKMGGRIELHHQRFWGAEPVADIVVYHSKLRGITVAPEWIANAIDELPIFFIAAACAEGTTFVGNLSELRVKESDRLAAMAQNLQTLGVACDVGADFIHIYGRSDRQFLPARVNSFGDHRIAMSLAVAGVRAAGELLIDDGAVAAVSMPQFRDFAAVIGMNVGEKDAKNCHD